MATTTRRTALPRATASSTDHLATRMAALSLTKAQARPKGKEKEPLVGTRAKVGGTDATAMAKKPTTTARRTLPAAKKEKENEAAGSKEAVVVKKEVKGKGKEKATESPEDRRLGAMRAVNQASQSLSVLVQSGWKYTSDAGGAAQKKSAAASAADVARHLTTLRELSDSDAMLDVERAAGSLSGKLVALEMYDAALLALRAMHPRLCRLLGLAPLSTNSTQLDLLSISLPDEATTPTPTLLTLTTTFLLHTLTVLSSQTPSKVPLSSFVGCLTLSSSTTLLTWARLIPPQHIDATLTRAYSCVVRLAATPGVTPNQAFALRRYGLGCLAHTESGKVEPRAFWDQATKAAGALIKATAATEVDAVTTMVLEAFGDLVGRAQRRPDAEAFMSGKAFAAFCECWTNCANRTRNISALGQVANVVGKPSTDTVDLSVQCTQSCTLFAQITAAKETDLMDAVDWAGVTLVLSNPDLHGKMYRAMEKARRSVITSVDEGNGGAAFVEKVMDVLECSVQQNPTNDTLTSLLDTIFSVSRWTLAASPPKAHATLTRAVAALDLATERKANYARCVSGAFHNLAGTLYNATKYGAAIPFLEDGCKLGGNARELRRQEQTKDDKNADGWKQLDEQLWRRWELLGVCFSKLGNRRSAHASFVECIKAFPYDLYPVCPKWFECSPATVQLGTIVDRTTYLGACELFLDPGEVVLVADQPLLLERQLASLTASRWKEGVQRVMQTLLRALLDVSKDRAGVLVACLEFGYYTGLSVVDGAADEVELLCADDPARLHTRASAHLWAALDAHKRAEPMTAHVALACRVLEGANAPKKTVASKPLRRTAKAQSSKTQSSKVQTPKVETPAQLLELLHLVARVLSLQRHVLLKVRVLDITRRLSQDSDATREGHVIACMELGIEYGRLGKTRRATGLFAQVYGSLGGVPEELCVLVCLRYAEALVSANDVARSVQVYTEAMERAQRSESTEKQAATTVERVYARVGRLEQAAVAASVFGLIQRAREDILVYAEAMLRALRLWNRAVDTLARLSPTSTFDDDPFSAATPSTTTKPRKITGVIEFRVSEGLLAILFSLCEMYSARGSAREAEYFAGQAHELAEGLAAITLSSRAVARRGEIQMHMRQITEAEASLALATADGIGRDAAELKGLAGDLSRLQDRDSDAGALYEQAYQILDEVDGQFRALEVDRSRQSAEFGQSVDGDLLADVLRKHIWLLRDNSTAYSALLQRFLALPASMRNNAQENVLLGRLTLHQVYDRFRTDMFLSESTIALPMSVPPPSHDILRTLESAEQLFWLDLTLFARTGDVTRVRDGSVSLAAVRALQTSLGHGNAVDGADAVLVAGLLDGASAIALGREMVEAIEHKVVGARRDDLEWVAVHEGAVTVAAVEDDDDEDASTQLLSEYWSSIKLKYTSQAPDISTMSASRMAGVPANWTVVHMTVTDDHRTLFVSRQYGSGTQPPLVFCIPLQGRDGADQHLTYDDAVREFAEIVKLSDQGTRGAVHVDKDDHEARAKWWRERSRLDGRMKELVENIEFCWLGAFKTILSPRSNLLPPAIAELRVQFDRVFQRALRLQDSKVGPQKLDDDLLACFATLSPKCRDEELEDLVYFVLDLYQLHGMPVAVAEVDIDQVVVDLRSVLEEHHRRQRGAAAVPPTNDEHVFLVLDKNLQGLPWESTPILRGRSVSRIPNLDFLLDRIKLASWQKHGAGSAAVVDRAVVNPRKGVCVLNPSGDLHKTEARFSAWTESQKTRNGWETIVGRPPSEMEFLRALSTSDLVVYFGHGGGEQYARAHRIRNLPRCAAVMLWGCSSGLLRDLGDYERIGTPWNYMVAGCPSLVANLWDVTDRDIDMFSQAVFDKLALGGPKRSDPVSVVAAVAQSRDVCKLKYLTGAAPVVYGIPFYL